MLDVTSLDLKKKNKQSLISEDYVAVFIPHLNSVYKTMQNSMQMGELHLLISAEAQTEISQVTGAYTLDNILEESL